MTEITTIPIERIPKPEPLAKVRNDLAAPATPGKSAGEKEVADHIKLPKTSVGDPISPLDQCAMRVRNIVLEFARSMSPDHWPTLLAELRDELDDIENVVQKSCSAGASPPTSPLQ